MIDCIFVIKKDSNDLIFYGQLSDENIEDLETVLGQIIMKAASQSEGTRKQIALKQGKFLYGVYNGYYMILALAKGTSKDIADRVLQKLGSEFGTNFGDKITEYSGDNSVFAGFSANVQSILQSFMKKPEPQPASQPVSSPVPEPVPQPIPQPSVQPVSEPNPGSVPKPVIPSPTSSSNTSSAPTDLASDDGNSGLTLSQRKGMITFQKTKQVVDDFTFSKPLISPAKREAYPDGIPEYARDEVLFNESFEVQKNFEAELINYSVSNIEITLNISLTHIYKIEIDFSDYPNLPKIKLAEGLVSELEEPIEKLSYFLRNWDPKIPPHITEIVYELEKIFTRFKSEGKLAATQEMPDYILPELKPLDGDLKWDPNQKIEEVVPPEYDGSDIAEKYAPAQSPASTAPQDESVGLNAPNQAQIDAKRQESSLELTEAQQKKLREEEKHQAKIEKMQKKMEEKQRKEQEKIRKREEKQKKK